MSTAPPAHAGWRSLRAHLRRHRGAYALGVVALVLVNGIDGVAIPWLQGAAFARLERPDAVSWSFAAIGLAFAAAALVQMGLRYAWRHFFIKTCDRIGGEVRRDLFQRLQTLPMAYYDRARTGDLMSRVTNDINDVRQATGMGMLLFADSIIYILWVVPQLLWISPRLALVTALFLPGVPVLVVWGARVLHTRGTRVQELLGDLTTRLQESFAGIRVIKAFGQEEREAARLEGLARGYLEGQVSLARFQAGFNPGLGLVFDLAQLVVLFLGGWDVLHGRLSLAEFVVYTRALDKIVWPMMAVGWVTGMLQRGAAAQARIDEVLEQAEDPAGLPGPTDRPALRGEVRVEGLTFRYPAAPPERAPALVEVGFTAPAGALVGVVGAVGAGKSTLLALLARLYDPPPGTVFLDGVDVRELPAGQLRRDVALVPQDTFLFSATIAENVALGRQGALSAEEVEEACQAAQVDAEVRGLPGGYQALLGERGVNLSGGQRQRLAIARALVRSPRVILLDDALAAVDAATEGAIADEIRRRQGPTRIVVTHRLSAVRGADLILVMDQGRIVDQGRHEELLARGGLYARLARREALEQELTRG